MSTYPSPTSGVGVAAKILVAGTENNGDTTPGYNDVVLSLSGDNGVESFQLNPQVVDVDDTPIELGTAYTLSAVASSSGNTAVYTGTIVATANSLVGKTFVVAGFVATPANNGTFICTANNGTTTITLENADAVAETHAATATAQESTQNLTYGVDGSASLVSGTYAPSGSPEPVVSVSAEGLLTTNGVTGGSVVEVSFPTFSNTAGTIESGQGTLPINKIYAEVNVTVVE
jgi:hypothetical protein